MQLRDYPSAVRFREKCDAKKAIFWEAFDKRFDVYEARFLAGADRFFEGLGYYKKKYLPTPFVLAKFFSSLLASPTTPTYLQMLIKLLIENK